MNRLIKLVASFIQYFKKHHWLLIVIFFFFLLVRNHRQLFLVDFNDGVLAKIYLGQHGYSIHSIAGYAKEFAFKNYDQHFIPIWFAIYFIFCLLNLNPVILGLITCFVAALFGYLLFETIINYTKKPNFIFSLFVTLAFMSTLMFVEVLAWKWMLCLLISTTSFLFCLSLLPKLKRWYLALFLLSLSVMIWTFSPGIVLGWCLVVYMLITRKLEKKKDIDLAVILASSLLLFASIVLVLTNTTHTSLNLVFLIVNIPSLLALITVSSLMTFLGIYKLTAVWTPFIALSLVSGSVIIWVFCYEIVIKFRKTLKVKNYALIVSMGLAYILSITLSTWRLMPKTGLHFIQDPITYITGNRYLFVFCLPLLLVIIYPLEKLFARFSKLSQYVLITSVLLLGFIISAFYTKLDPYTNSKERSNFYSHIPNSIQIADREELVLPNISSNILLMSQNIPLKEAMFYRNEARQYALVFVEPNNMLPADCQKLMAKQQLSSWLDTYSTNWCREYK